MSRSALRILAVVLTTAIIVVGVNAFDHLPGSLRTRIQSERAALTAAHGQLQTAQDQVARETQADPGLFTSVSASRQWPVLFQNATGTLQRADREMKDLSALADHGHYRDRQRAESLLSDERAMRAAALQQASGIQAEAAGWIARSRNLPSELQQMERSYETIHGFDLSALTTAVQKAETNWPDKKADLDSRLSSVRDSLTRDEQVWQATAESRRAAAAGKTDLDTGALLTAADELKASADALPKQSAGLQSQVGQLYDSWDRVLVDMEARGFGSARTYSQKIRTVRTHLGTTTSDEEWVTVSPAVYDSMHNDLGMAIEHKPAGEYDSEAERVAQPAGFAYIAPPAQGSNQYGYWDHHDGQSFWVFYGQYALLRDLLFNRGYRPLDRYEWEGYRTEQSRGRTYYGQGTAEGSSAPKYGTNGTATQDRYTGSSYAHNGGFRDSQYSTKSGTYRNSPYASPLARNGENAPEPKTFGRNSHSEEHHAAPPREPSYHPAPRPAPSRRPSGSGMRFGRRR